MKLVLPSSLEPPGATWSQHYRNDGIENCEAIERHSDSMVFRPTQCLPEDPAERPTQWPTQCLPEEPPQDLPEAYSMGL